MLELGLKCVPKDVKALAILDQVMNNEPPVAINKLVNGSFSEFLEDVRPIYRTEQGLVSTAAWCVGDKPSNRVVSLISTTGEAGYWCDSNGTKVSVIAIEGGK